MCKYLDAMKFFTVVFLLLLSLNTSAQGLLANVENSLVSKERLKFVAQKNPIDWLKYDFEHYLKNNDCLNGLTPIDLSLSSKNVKYILSSIQKHQNQNPKWDNSFIEKINQGKSTKVASAYLTDLLVFEEMNLAFIGIGSKSGSQYVYVFQKRNTQWSKSCEITFFVE